MSIDPNDPRPPYQQVADDLRRTIHAGDKYAPGARLPSIRELAKSYGISPQTVQNALRELRQEQLVVSQQGRAFFVRDPRRPAADAGRGDDTHERLAAVEAELHDLQGKIAAFEGDLDPHKQIAALRVQIMDLYARIGQPYPRESSSQVEPAREQVS
jgi:GntR family transcriptional regulator